MNINSSIFQFKNSSLDGVSIDLGEVDGVRVGLEPIDLNTPGNGFFARATGVVNGRAGRPLGTAGCQNNGGRIQALADFSALGTSTVLVEVYAGGTLVGRGITRGGRVVADVTPGPDGAPQIIGCGKLPPVPWPCFIIDLDRLGTINLAGTTLGGTQVPLVGDQVRLLANNPDATVDAVSEFDMTGANLPSIVINGIAVDAFGNLHGALGDAGLRGIDLGDRLVVSNIGSSGEDGVSNNFEEIKNGGGFLVELEPVDLGNPGSALLMEARGTLGDVGTTGDVARSSLGIAGLHNNAGTLQAEVDYAAIGATDIRVEVFDGPERVGSHVVSNPGDGIVGVLTGEPLVTGCGKLPTFPGGPTFPEGLPCYLIRLDRIATITPTGGEPMRGDQLRLLAANASERINSLTGLELRGIDLRNLILVGERQIFPQPTDQLVITGMEPQGGAPGQIITLRGEGFGDDPDDLCAVVMDGSRSLPLQVLTAEGTTMTARLLAIPPDARGGPIMVARGRGQRGLFKPIFDDVMVEENVWIWQRVPVNGPVAETETPFRVVHVRPQTDQQWFFSGRPVNGRLCLFLSGNWQRNSIIEVQARAHDHRRGIGRDLRAIRIRLAGGGTTFACARRICDVIECAFLQQAGIRVNCRVDRAPGAQVKITLTLPDGNIDWGNLNVCVTPRPVVPPVIKRVWSFDSGGIWRKEVRSRVLARWYRHYEWTVNSRIWLKRRAEGVWIFGQALNTFTCRTHCIQRNPNGPGIWQIWRTFRRADVRRFRMHYRIWWVGHLNRVIADEVDAAQLGDLDPLNRRFATSMDHIEIVTPMEPEDPDPNTPFNEAVEIIDENGDRHFLGDDGFALLPDTAMNPNGFQLVSTAQSTRLLPPPAQRLGEGPIMQGDGMVETEPGVVVEWLVDEDGNVLVDRDDDGSPDDITSPGVLGGQKHPGLLPEPEGEDLEDGNELGVDQGNTPLQLYCWLLDETGEVLGSNGEGDGTPLQVDRVVIGPPEDLDGDQIVDNAIGAPVPMDPTTRELVSDGIGGFTEVLIPDAVPTELAFEQEPEPTDEELNNFNNLLRARFGDNFPLTQRPFALCLRKFHVKRIWGIDRRVVFDTWMHHWSWRLRNHFTLRRGAYRIWLTKRSIINFNSRHHHFPFGGEPTSNEYNATHVRFFRICYRVFIPEPNVVRMKIDAIHVAVPEDPNDPNSDLMLISTASNENALFDELPPAVLAGLTPDPLPVDDNGVFIEVLDPVRDTLDLSAGGAGIFEQKLSTLSTPDGQDDGGMEELIVVGNEDMAEELNNNQLPMYCWMLDGEGNLAQDVIDLGNGETIPLATGPTPAIPVFEQDGEVVNDPTMFTLEVGEVDIVLAVEGLPGDGTFPVTILETEIGRQYSLEFKASLNDTDWNLLQSFPGTGAPITLPVTLENETSGFFRVVAED